MSEHLMLLALAILALLVVRAVFKTVGCVLKAATLLVLVYVLYNFLI